MQEGQEGREGQEGQSGRQEGQVGREEQEAAGRARRVRFVSIKCSVIRLPSESRNSTNRYAARALKAEGPE
jgi:hypothetical protein